MLIRRVSGLTGSVFIAVLLAAALTFGACSTVDGSGDEAIAQEYADLNGTTTSSGQQYRDVHLPEDHVFTTVSEQEAVDFLRDGTGMIYFGFPECPWCRAAVPVMDEAAKSLDIDQIRYLNVLGTRDTRSLAEDGTVVIDEPGSDAYADIIAELGNFAPEYEGLNDPTQRRIYVPLVVAVEDGEVVGSHMSTVESQTDPFEPMTDAQHDELIGIYQDLFS